MIQSYQIRRAIIVLIAVVLLVLLVAGMANLFRSMIGSEGAEATPDTAIVLTDYDSDSSSLRLIYDGRVIANEERRSLRITISSEERVFELLEGYDGRAVKRKTFPNTSSAYQNLVRGAAFEGFAIAQDNNLGDDERGICPEGQRTVTEVYDHGEVVSRLWAASCNRKLGTLGGDARALVRLFQAQIPEYKELTSGVRF